MGFFRDLFRELKRTKPVLTDPKQSTIEDEVYGRLDWVTDPGCWIGTYICPVSGPFRLIVDPSEDQDRLPMADLRTFYASIKSRIGSSKEMAVEDFLPGFNEDWNEGAPLSSTQFSSLFKPESIHVWSYGNVEISFQEADDTEPLGGHSL